MSSAGRNKFKASEGGTVSEPSQNYMPVARTNRRSRKKVATTYVPGIPENFELSPEFSGTFDMMEGSRKHLFITGNAGTGKSTLLHYFKEKTKKQVVVLAPTGIAAINAGGATIHSFFRFPTRLVTPDDVRAIRSKRKLFASLDTIVIDEVSMVRADIMDAIDLSLRVNRDRPEEAFGGVQIIVIGDLHQLPPVVEPGLIPYFSEAYPSPYFFSARVFGETQLATIGLQRIFRQSDAEFVGLLNKVRNNRISPADLRHLNRLHSPVASFGEDDLAITLTSTNALASKINQSHLDSLPTRDFCFDADVTGDFDENSFPTDKRLKLRQGAQIMMVKNDPNKEWVNGSLGVVQKLSRDSIKVAFGDRECTVVPATWERIDYSQNPADGKIEPVATGSFRQYPIKLAWAITIHKSQGKTFDRVIIDLGNGAFTHGQTYVALSRCTSYEGIRLRTPLRLSDIIVDHRVTEFHSRRRDL